MHKGGEKMKIISKSCEYFLKERRLQCRTSRGSPGVGGLMSKD